MANVTLVVFTYSYKQLPSIVTDSYANNLASNPNGSFCSRQTEPDEIEMVRYLGREAQWQEIINITCNQLRTGTSRHAKQAESSFLLTRLVMDQVIWLHEGKINA